MVSWRQATVSSTGQQLRRALKLNLPSLAWDLTVTGPLPGPTCYLAVLAAMGKCTLKVEKAVNMTIPDPAKAIDVVKSSYSDSNKCITPPRSGRAHAPHGKHTAKTRKPLSPGLGFRV